MSHPLKKELEGVIPESLPEYDADPAIEESKAGEPADDPNLADDNRPPENLKGEMDRKFDVVNDNIGRLVDRIDKFTSGQKVPESPSAQPQNPFDGYSIDQLNDGLIAENVDEAVKQQIRVYLPARIAKETAQTVFAQNQQQVNIDVQRKTARQDAVNTYPDLLDETSPLAKEASRILVERGGEEWAKQNPTAAIDVANAAAVRLGIPQRPSLRGGRRMAPQPPGGSKENIPLNRQKIDKPDEVPAAELATMNSKLGHLLGKDENGKQRVFDKDFIKERKALYKNRYPDLEE